MMEIWIVGWAITFAMAYYENELDKDVWHWRHKTPLEYFFITALVLFITWPIFIFIVSIYKSIRRIQNEKHMDQEIHNKD